MIAQSLETLRLAMEKARAASPLAGGPVTLVAASKQQPEEKLLQALAAGVRDFGENRVQEALAKWPGLRVRFPDVRLHLIGPLQTNKVREAVELFDVIQTVDREALADALVREMERQGKRPDCFLQVNTGEEPQKAGVLPVAAEALIAYCRKRGLPVAGLMCVPPAEAHPAPHFALLHKLAREHGLPCLSMGMSGDFDIAVRLGATHVRIGTALFGQRA